MFVILGAIIVIGGVLGGFTMAGGSFMALVHPSEIVTIGGAVLGAMVIMSPTKVLKDLMSCTMQCFKGTPYDKSAYEDLFKALYDLFRLSRREGLLALEKHISDPHKSDIFHKYPKFGNNHHAVEFVCGGISPVIDGTIKPDQIPGMMSSEIKILEEEHHAVVGVMSKTSDGMPGFGIVAAVLGIVITMGAIDGPIEEIGHSVGAALVGTFLGILVSYGFLAPLALRMEFLGLAEVGYLKTIVAAIAGFVGDMPPKVALESARRNVGNEYRPTRQQMEAWFAQVEKGG
ncbi:MAG: flagellar motor stator protein MotA [Pirellulales bacterium]